MDKLNIYKGSQMVAVVQQLCNLQHDRQHAVTWKNGRLAADTNGGNVAGSLLVAWSIVSEFSFLFPFKKMGWKQFF